MNPYMTKTERLFREREREASEGAVICDYCKGVIIDRFDCVAHRVLPLVMEGAQDYILVHHRCHNEIHKMWRRLENCKKS